MSKARKQDVMEQQRPAVVVEQGERSRETVPVVDRGLIAQLVGGAREQGMSLDGEGGLLAQLTKLVLESALEGEITDQPAIVKKRQRRLGSIEDVVLSLSARGMTHGDISAHLADVYGSEVSKTTISTITDKVLDGMAEWQGRPLDPGLPGGVHRRDPRQGP